MATTTKTEATELMEILEDAYWRLKEIDTQDLCFLGLFDMEDRVAGLINDMEKYFA